MPVDSPSELSARTVPFINILHLVADQRDEESYVAGSCPLNLSASRFSGDIDDRAARVAEALEKDAAILAANGFELEWLRKDPMIHSVLAPGPVGHHGSFACGSR